MSETEKPLYVERLRIRGFRGAVDVDITPQGYVIVIAGKNGAGKSSVVDAPWAAIQWAAAKGSMPDPIHNDAEEFEICLDLGEFTVVRSKERGKSPVLKVKRKDGAKLDDTPQKLLDDFVGHIAFDPGEFGRLSERDQRSLLIKCFADQLPFNLDEMAAERKRLYDERTGAWQYKSRMEGHLAETPEPPDGLPAKEVSLETLNAEYAKAAKQHASVKEVNAEVAASDTAVRRANEGIERANASLESAQRALEDAHGLRDAASGRVAKMNKVLPDGPPDLDEIQARMACAAATNEACAAARGDALRRTRAEADTAGAQAAWKVLDDSINAIDARKAAALAKIKMPVEGLGFDDSRVTFDSGAGPVALGGCSTAEQLTAIVGIGMYTAKRLRVIRFKNGNDLDEEHSALLEELAEKHEFQIWKEERDPPKDKDGNYGESVVVMEDGCVVDAS